MLGWLVAIAFGGASAFLVFRQFRDARVAKLEDRLADLLTELQAAEETTAGVPELIEAHRRAATRLIRLVPPEFTMSVVHAFVKLDRLERQEVTVLADIMSVIETAKAQSARKWILPPTPAAFNRLNLRADHAVQAGQKLSSEVESVRLSLLNLADARSTRAGSTQTGLGKQILEATS